MKIQQNIKANIKNPCQRRELNPCPFAPPLSSGHRGNRMHRMQSSDVTV